MAEIMKNPVVTGVGGAVAGLAVGALLSLSTIDAKIGASTEDAMDEIAALVSGDEAAMSGVTERIESMEDAVTASSDAVVTLDDTVSDQAGAIAALAERMPDDLGTRISALESRIDTAATDLGNRISETAASQTDTLRAALEAQPATEPAPSTATADETASAPEDTSRAALPEGLRMEGEARGVGETFVLAGGAVRAFVQRADAEAGRAWMSVNRVSSELAVGDTVVVPHEGGACRVGVAAITDDGVQIGSDCNTAADEGALGDAYAPGHLAMLADGQLRVFVSGLFGDEARLAINGLETRRLRVGDTHSVTVDDAECSVTVNGIRGNSVLLTGGCA